MKKILYIVTASFLILIHSACKRDALSAYEKMEKRELATGIRKDSLFLKFYLGMPYKTFFDSCWAYNKQQLIKEGPGNASALIELDTPLMKYKTLMDFYPKFYEDKIYFMPVRFQYKSWNPVTPEFQLDKLQMDVLQLMENWYGKGFIRIQDPMKGRVFVKIEGNRRISIRQDLEKDVVVKIVDLSVPVQKDVNGW
jgi:hypothetical protein